MKSEPEYDWYLEGLPDGRGVNLPPPHMTFDAYIDWLDERRVRLTLSSRQSRVDENSTDLSQPERLSAQRTRTRGRPDCARAGRPSALQCSSGFCGNIFAVERSGSGTCTVFLDAEEDQEGR